MHPIKADNKLLDIVGWPFLWLKRNYAINLSVCFLLGLVEMYKKTLHKYMEQVIHNATKFFTEGVVVDQRNT